MKRWIAFFILLALFSFSVSAQVYFFPNEPPVTIRDPVSRSVFQVNLLAYAVTSPSITESDLGIDPFEAGTNIFTIQGFGSPTTISDFNRGNDVIELISNNFEVFDGTNWLLGNGFTIAVKMSPTQPRLGLENGLGAVSGTTYLPYINNNGISVSPNRLYTPSQTLKSLNQLSSYTAPNNALVLPGTTGTDIQGDIVTVGLTYPFTVNNLVQLSSGFCPNFNVPSVVIVGLGFPFSYCVYLNSYMHYMKPSELSTLGEGNVQLRPASAAAIQATTGTAPSNVVEGNPSVSGQYVAYETSFYNQEFDIAIFNTQTSTAVVIPEINAANRRIQSLVSMDYPFAAFLERDQNTAPFVAELHFYDVNTNVRTTIPIDVNAFALLGGPGIAYDSVTQTAVLAWLRVSNNNPLTLQLQYATYQNGVLSGVNTLPLPTNAGGFSVDRPIPVISSGGNKIYFGTSTFPPTAPQQPENQIWEYDMSLGTSTLLYTAGSGVLLGNLQVSGDQKLISFFSASIGVPITTLASIIVNIDRFGGQCSNAPCLVQQLGSESRTISASGGPITETLSGGFIYLDKQAPNIYATRQTPVASTISLGASTTSYSVKSLVNL